MRRSITINMKGRNSIYAAQKKDLTSLRTNFNKTSMEDVLKSSKPLNPKNSFSTHKKNPVQFEQVPASVIKPATSKAFGSGSFSKKEKPDPFAAFLARHPEIAFGDTPTPSSKKQNLSKSIQIGSAVSKKQKLQAQQSHMRLNSAASGTSHLVRSSSDLNNKLEKKKAFQQFRHERFSILIKRREVNKINKELIKMEQDKADVKKAVQAVWLSQIFLASHLRYIRVAYIFQKKLNEKKQKNVEFRLSVDSHVRQYLEVNRNERAQLDLLVSAR